MYPFPRKYYEGFAAPPTSSRTTAPAASRTTASATSRITRSTNAPTNKAAAARAIITRQLRHSSIASSALAAAVAATNNNADGDADATDDANASDYANASSPLRRSLRVKGLSASLTAMSTVPSPAKRGESKERAVGTIGDAEGDKKKDGLAGDGASEVEGGGETRKGEGGVGEGGSNGGGVGEEDGFNGEGGAIFMPARSLVAKRAVDRWSGVSVQSPSQVYAGKIGSQGWLNDQPRDDSHLFESESDSDTNVGEDSTGEYTPVLSVRGGTEEADEVNAGTVDSASANAADPKHA